MAREVAAAGYPVVLHAHRSVDAAAALVAEITTAGGQAYVVQADLADAAALPGLLAQAAQAGPLYGLINNASRFVHDQAADVTAASITAHMAANLTAPVLLAQGFAAGLTLERGVIINMLDQKLANLNPDFFAYTLSKAALAAASEMLAMALAPRIRVCGIAPGLTMQSPKQTAQRFEQAWRANPLRRGSLPEDIAAAALFILRTPSLTGTTLVVDGGEHLMHRQRDISFTDT